MVDALRCANSFVLLMKITLHLFPILTLISSSKNKRSDVIHEDAYIRRFEMFVERRKLMEKAQPTKIQKKLDDIRVNYPLRYTIVYATEKSVSSRVNLSKHN